MYMGSGRSQTNFLGKYKFGDFYTDQLQVSNVGCVFQDDEIKISYTQCVIFFSSFFVFLMLKL